MLRSGSEVAGMHRGGEALEGLQHEEGGAGELQRLPVPPQIGLRRDGPQDPRAEHPEAAEGCC